MIRCCIKCVSFDSVPKINIQHGANYTLLVRRNVLYSELLSEFLRML
jgi:hypothetical protein